jgi:hypothetical protein
MAKCKVNLATVRTVQQVKLQLIGLLFIYLFIILFYFIFYFIFCLCNEIKPSTHFIRCLFTI